MITTFLQLGHGGNFSVDDCVDDVFVDDDGSSCFVPQDVQKFELFFNGRLHFMQFLVDEEVLDEEEVVDVAPFLANSLPHLLHLYEFAKVVREFLQFGQFGILQKKI